MPDHENLQATSPEEEPRIGVYVCYCGGNISDVVHCDQVAATLHDGSNVVVSRTDMSMCSDAAQSMIVEDIKKHNLNRLVVGACSPFLHEQTFRGTAARAGLNPYLYHHVGLREQDSWAHHDREAATAKAIRLMWAGIAKARHLTPLEPIRLEARQHALVIGGGVAGLRSALDIARRGLRVTLVEKSPFLGGHMARLETMFPVGNSARQVLSELIDKVVTHPDITVFTQAELTSVKGYVGDFQVDIRQQSRGVTDDIAEAVLAADLPQVPDEYNYGLTKRKIVYQAYPGCYPTTPAVDWDHCLDGRLELQLNGKTVVLENAPQTFDLNVGAVVVATGFKLYELREGELGYKEIPEVLTLAQLIRLLALSSDGQSLEWNGHPVRTIAMVHCVGSRQIDGVHEPQPDGQVNNYCSRVCCTATLHAICDLRERFPNINVYDVYEDIRTYGRGHEDYYLQASEEMTRFLRFHGEEPPQVVQSPASDPYPVLVKVKDHLTWGKELEVPADLVVLATGMMPAPVDDLIDILKISPGTDRFLLEVHPKLRPVETAVPGIVLAGTAQGPMNIQETCAAAGAAAAKVAGQLAQGSVQLDPFVVRVDEQRCTGTGQCVQVCSYEGAIVLQMMTIDGQQAQRAVVSPANCTGCGACVSACPNRAIDLQGWTLEQYDAMVEAIVAELPVLEAVK